MKFRKKYRRDGSEVFTDSLNDILFILLMFFLIVATMANPNVQKVNLAKGKKDTKARQDITVSVDKEQNFYIGTKKYNLYEIDSALTYEIIRQKALKDTPVVVIRADTSAYFGNVFKLRRIAQINKVRMVESVAGN